MSDRPDFPGMTMREVREALGHVTAASDTVKPIEVGQTYQPTEYNQARLPTDRITVTRVWTSNGEPEQSIAYDIATVDYRGCPITTQSAMRESVFRKCYALDAPEPDPAAAIKRALDRAGGRPMSSRTITREQAESWGLPHDLTDRAKDVTPGIAVELHREEDTGRRRWASENTLVFRAPDDGKAYRVTYFQGLTETQYDHDVWNDERQVELTEVKPVNAFTVEWHAVGDKAAPAQATPEPVPPQADEPSAHHVIEHALIDYGYGPTTARTLIGNLIGEQPTPAGDHFTEAAIRRGAYLDAANALADPGPSVCDCGRCAACALHQASQQLRRLADHYTTAEQPTGLTWEARADHAVRLYARTAIDMEDAKAEAARLRARVAELEQLADAPNAVTVGHVETALRAWLTDFDYDLHKNLQCGEEDGEDHYPDEAAAFFQCLFTAVESGRPLSPEDQAAETLAAADEEVSS